MPLTARNRGDVATAPWNTHRKRSLEVKLRTANGSRNQHNLTTGVSRGVTPEVDFDESNMMDTFGASNLS